MLKEINKLIKEDEGQDVKHIERGYMLGYFLLSQRAVDQGRNVGGSNYSDLNKE